MDERQAQAFIRFGLGRRAGEPPPPDPRAWLAAQLDADDPLLADAEPRTATAFGIIARYLDPQQGPGQEIGAFLQRHQSAALAHAVTTKLPFRERLVWFWTNHFCVSARRGAWVVALMAPYVREAIRPHVTGRFGDMLQAVMHHPGMLDYLDNLWSAGPASAEGRREGRAHNENLARECLELHTLGAAGGFAQADVTALAMLLTGWSAQWPADPAPGFRFRAEWHEPGAKTLLGQTYPEGLCGGEAALAALAEHPATHRHIAEKLARHFVADDPAEDAVARIAAVLRETGGDLKQVMLALLDLEDAWRPLKKYRTPVEFVVALFRALDLDPSVPEGPAAVAHTLGQPFWFAPLPNGWPDRAASWSGGEALLRRADWVLRLGGRARGADAEGVAECALGPFLADRTRAALRSTTDPRQALALLFASPEFQRR